MDYRTHYERLAPSFTRHWSYTPEFVSWMTGCLVERLQLGAGDCLVDCGCGTGIYTTRLVEHAARVICLDPIPAMLEHLPADPRLVPSIGTVEQLAIGHLLVGELFDAVLLKEVIHHVNDPPATIHALARRLASGGRLLVAMLPPTIDYPLFPAALARYNRGKLTPDHVAGWMADAGLHVTTSAEQHQVDMPTEQYLDMVNDRYLSLLARFTDTEIAAGIRYIQRQHPGDSITFTDRFAFVLGVRAH
ncbi:class I SAM-dependent methyltransferase [Actinophytocola xanthii]|uniref:Methyltransferase type 11 domain-containing protein n=1 Tax=Actinophytocola xanthii TaxID=1912961 RepID=A0A1Q8BXU8_9PSEU|nr:class I SAM-dependent methyltransferase [Actinophytocola xanthii]OLF06924.1 hypothetical protein BU204_36005 [Actinophytocola xanthii]